MLFNIMLRENASKKTLIAELQKKIQELKSRTKHNEEHWKAVVDKLQVKKVEKEKKPNQHLRNSALSNGRIRTESHDLRQVPTTKKSKKSLSIPNLQHAADSSMNGKIISTLRQYYRC